MTDLFDSGYICENTFILLDTGLLVEIQFLLWFTMCDERNVYVSGSGSSSRLLKKASKFPINDR